MALPGKTFNRIMSLSHFGEFDCDFTANQLLAVQSQRSLRGVSVESRSMANPLRMRCECVANWLLLMKKKKNNYLQDKKAGKVLKKVYLED